MTKTQTPPPHPASSAVHLSHLSPSVVPLVHRLNSTSTTSSSVRKTPRRALSPSSLRQRAAEKEEMQSLLAKLQQLVPGIPKKRRLPKLEIIQHVIDYIFDLQVALEQHPISALDLSSWPVELGPVPVSLGGGGVVVPREEMQNCGHLQQQQLPPSSACDYYQRIPGVKAERQPLASIML